MKKQLCLNQFWIRLIATITMVIDHIALFMAMFGFIETTSLAYVILRIIGRLSFPLFATMIVEGVYRTRHISYYLFRLGGCAIGLGLVYLILESFEFHIAIPSNLFLTLFLGAVVAYFIKRKGIYTLFAILLVGLSFVPHFVVVPNYLNPDYASYGLVLFALLSVAHLLADKKSKDIAFEALEPYSNYQETPDYKRNINIGYCVALIIVNVLYYLVTTLIPSFNIRIAMTLQDYSMLAIFIILMYNGKRGYDSDGYRIFNYLFYPVHIAILFLIFMLIY